MNDMTTLRGPLAPWLKHVGLMLLSLGFVCASLWLITPAYMINDNVTIMDYAVHGFAMPYASIFFTNLLHLGYVSFPEVPWYGLGLYALHVLAIYLWLVLVFRVFRPAWLAVLCAVLLLAYYLVFLVDLDYTSTSIMLCSAALTWAYLEVMDGYDGRRRWLALGLVFMLGMMMRPHGAPGTIVYTLPFGLLAAWVGMGEVFTRSQLRRLLVIGALFLLPAVAEYGLDQAWRNYSATPQQRQYDAFNDVRGELQSISRGRKQAIIRNVTLLKSVGWTRRDAAFFFNWNFLDERIYTPEALRALLAAAPLPHPSFSTVMDTVERRFPPADALFLLFVAPVPLLLSLAHRRRGFAVAGALIPLYAVGLTSFMILYFAFEPRVRLPFETALGFCGLLVAARLPLREQPRPARTAAWMIGLAVALAGLGAADSLWQEWPGFRHHTGYAAKVQQILDSLNREHAGDVILLQPDSGLRLEALSPLKVIHMDFHPIQLGWSTFSPRFYSQIGELGVSHGYQLVDALIINDRAYILGHKSWCEQLLAYATLPGADKLQPVRVERGVELFRFSKP